MSELRKEMHERLDAIPERKLAALQPLLTLLSNDDDFFIETDLTDEERATIAQGWEEHRRGETISLEDFKQTLG